MGRGDPDLGRPGREREVEQGARLVLGDPGERRHRLELDLDRRARVAQLRLERVERRADRDRLAHRLGVTPERERRHLAPRARDPQPAERPVDHGAGCARPGDRPRRETDRARRTDPELDRPRPAVAVDQPQLERAILADAEQPARLLAAGVIDAHRGERQPAHGGLVAVIAAAVRGLDVADHEAQAQRAVAAADRRAAVAERHHRADPAVTAGRHRALPLAHHPQLTVGRAREPQPRRIPRHRADRPVGQRAPHRRTEHGRGIADRQRHHVQRAIRGAGRDRPGIAARRALVERQRAHRRTQRQLRDAAAPGDVPRDQPAILAAADQELVAREAQRADRAARAARVERPSGRLAVEDRRRNHMHP